MNKLENLINYYSPLIKTAGVTPPYSQVERLISDYVKKVKEIDSVEAEVITYLSKEILLCEWKDEYLWIYAAITKPSEQYIDYYLRIIQTDNNNNPHWRILDALAYMSDESNNKIVEGIEEAILLNNQSWKEEDLKKAFEVLTWISDDAKIFIEKMCKSHAKKIAEMAQYWLEVMDEDEE